MQLGVHFSPYFSVAEFMLALLKEKQGNNRKYVRSIACCTLWAWSMGGSMGVFVKRHRRQVIVKPGYALLGSSLLPLPVCLPDSQ